MSRTFVSLSSIYIKFHNRPSHYVATSSATTGDTLSLLQGTSCRKVQTRWSPQMSVRHSCPEWHAPTTCPLVFPTQYAARLTSLLRKAFCGLHMTVWRISCRGRCGVCCGSTHHVFRNFDRIRSCRCLLGIHAGALRYGQSRCRGSACMCPRCRRVSAVAETTIRCGLTLCHQSISRLSWRLLESVRREL